ncbi:MAG: MATE family efflux transporter [Bacilli bacterium]|nr:MATE family efflux transporter [Bacilli bacterium]
MVANKMETMGIKKLVITMALPPLLSMFMQYSYNLIDSGFVAQISEDALTAISLSFPLTTLMNALSIWLGVGVNILVARYLGRKEQENANNIAYIGLLLSIIVGIISNIACLLVLKPYFAFFTDNPLIYQYCIDYMSICAFMQIPNMVHIVIQKTLQGTGNMLAPMGFQMIGVIFNIIFDPLLIFGYGIFPKLGIKGAALSTVLGFSLSMIIALYMLFFTKQKVKITKSSCHINLRFVKAIFVIGFPSFIMNALNAFMVTICNVFLIVYSLTAVTFFGVYYKIQQVVVMTMNGLIQGVLPIMSYSYGAKKLDRLNETFKFGLECNLTFMVIATLIMFIFPKEILLVFNATEDLLNIGVSGTRIMCLSYLFIGASLMIATYFQACKKVSISIIINLLRQLVILFPIMYLLSNLFKLNGIWYSFLIAEMLTFIYALTLYLTKKKQLISSLKEN